MCEEEYYWYTKRKLPKEAKKKIKEMVQGEIIGEIGFSGIHKKLLTVSG